MLELKKLREKLLATNCFTANSYFTEYLELITTKAVPPAAFKTQTHHILPKTYFKKLSLAVDDSDENLVELLFKDHVYAHWLLSKCATSFLRRNSCYAVRYLLSSLNLKRYNNSLTETDLVQLQECYEHSLLSINKAEFISYYNAHLCRETAKHFSIGLNTVTRLAIEYDCLKCKKRHSAKSRKLISKSTLATYYLDDNHALMDTATYFNVDKSTIIRLVNDYKLFKKLNNKHYQNRALLNAIDKQQFIDYYATHSRAETVTFFGLESEQQVAYLRKKFKVVSSKCSPKTIIRLNQVDNTASEYIGSREAAAALINEQCIEKTISSISRAIRDACAENKVYRGFI